ncbi:voltage-dependent calcium channel subunit alpha-2/delta-3 isoform X1 [Bombus terrestris]|uniref:Voltage-dependent calcium channel subunit alpha-2/delta-3 isoform X1 n=1 Tax=Bombus terrestris TaxID=30195 RepID=A0A9B2JET7_BOMTE|nr:voltage-dependent calcium channel subunit alpha-2/delta-3 isoform X1 [Bombus terrestris]XP_012164248.2 voltage-dependent calcium channel subunit alpha-2/delta-3 isoform X1 [Bombus terrestris]XP_012164249.2 voltage-dependent calcium channel subunit alpha-2/delta-3 isoform X1 [Bombus terrestris]XP_012164250.2 voltage-dependent calcium channel subunit alpha-2/delta-3 isoform X1 [Bombus terrestris]XP_048261652.1 voltage-dependent calcium channel subunit alpha-2/delta-3 isoform X1 [Bombus terrest
MRQRFNIRWIILTICFLLCTGCLAKDGYIVTRWAETLGDELWELAEKVARPEELLSKYKAMNTRVENKSGEELVNIISENVGRMLRRKMDAVTCIRMAAEEHAENWENDEEEGNFTYVSGKYSPVNAELPKVPSNMEKNIDAYRKMLLTADSHFYNIPVNTSFSSVHIPTNVYDMSPAVIEDIKKTEILDNIFQQNYESDPALSWQYFGSVTGMLRQYPAMQWKMDPTQENEGGEEEDEEKPDIYDCRVRSWFIEAATCSKDMVILMDTSGSMTGMGKTIARTTVNAILDTLSNNDFVTVLSYTNVTYDVVPCFKDMLIQATPENVYTFKNAIANVKTEGLANLTEAFTRAFNLLSTYRETRGCGADTSCNQLIMLVTDGVPGNLTEVFRTWNWRDNDTHIPVRVFTYLLGKEVTKVREIQWMACLNRGYYTHVHTLEEVREQVLKYIPVVARPMVLQDVVHPVVWTHAYADITNPALATWLWLVMQHKEQQSRLQKLLKGKRLGVRINEDDTYIQKLHKSEDVRQDASLLNTTAWQEYRLLTSVSTPVFDRKGNRNNRTRIANLLGVAGTDVPIDDIRKLTLPYKLGVNGYAFIVSNNGYVILHPDLRPVYKGTLKRNYNSIDLTEVEILDDGRGPRNPGPEVLELRAALVDHKKGSLKGVPVKLHYDDNRRVSLERRDYFFAPLPGTPFGLAVAIPNYGTTWIKVGDEIRRNQNLKVNISDFFMGNNWRVHPGWVYCRFHYLEGHEFNSPEQELRHFLDLLNKPGWRWSEQYENETDDVPNCGRRTLSQDDYYCNKELMQLLVFDAKATNASFNSDFVLDDPRARQLAEDYGIFLRFVATQSGLTRWHHLDTNKLPEDDDGIVFGDLHRRAVNEPWYKGAIFQNILDPNSISLSVPWEAGVNATVTASIGIFPKDDRKTAPAAVIGFQMPMKHLYKRFINLTSGQTNSTLINCRNLWIDCYLLDQNGFIVISEAHNDTGQFMGTQEGAVMNSMVGQGLYNPVDIYDYQAWCEEVRISGAATSLTDPLMYIWKLLLWFLLRVTWFTTQFVNLPVGYAKVHFDEDAPDPPPPPRPCLYHYPCDQKRVLYMMNNTIAGQGITNHSDYCSRPFYARRVPHTNLLLVVVDAMYPTCYKRLEVTPVTISPLEYANGSESAPCHKIPLNDLKRRRLEGCFTEHPLEYEIEDCGGASQLTVSLLLFSTVVAKILYTFI